MTLPWSRAGGSSPKLAYVKRFTFDKGDSKREPRFYVFGSGLYLGQEEVLTEFGEGNRGCAIAGADSTPGSSLLSLLLVGFAVLFLRKRIYHG